MDHPRRTTLDTFDQCLSDDSYYPDESPSQASTAPQQRLDNGAKRAGRPRLSASYLQMLRDMGIGPTEQDFVYAADSYHDKACGDALDKMCTDANDRAYTHTEPANTPPSPMSTHTRSTTNPTFTPPPRRAAPPTLTPTLYQRLKCHICKKHQPAPLFETTKYGNPSTVCDACVAASLGGGGGSTGYGPMPGERPTATVPRILRGGPEGFGESPGRDDERDMMDEDDCGGGFGRGFGRGFGGAVGGARGFGDGGAGAGVRTEMKAEMMRFGHRGGSAAAGDGGASRGRRDGQRLDERLDRMEGWMKAMMGMVGSMVGGGKWLQGGE